ncbi:copper amine oxidase N-terminal domain-containing protein [[Clostridium] colinum]|uniref:copper amine oxidase N-terminal domain-containing protein n=1 Tax=[Clostridium] colinum TaxID=36835 RepID=UPI0020254547|nr:copper amine oxidase N-terminal domain-containing protein [[Clostridium] colinum]
MLNLIYIKLKKRECNFIKKFIAVILSSTIIFTSGANVFANTDLKIEQAIKIKENKVNLVREKGNISVSDNVPNILVNGKKLEVNKGEVVYENNNYIPVRELADALSLKLDYIAESKIVVLDNGKIQLPIDNNKASVNGNIVDIDKDNKKVCPLIIDGKAYIPVNFVKNLGYNVEYNKKDLKQLEGFTKLDKAQAIEAYKQINEANQNIKNATIDLNSNMDFTISDNTNTLAMKANISGTTNMDINKEKPGLYSEQKITLELMGEKETIEQKSFFKDNKLYVKVNESGQEQKYKMDLNIEEAIQMSNNMNVNNLLNEEFILDGSFKNLENGNKQYMFNVDLNKAFDFIKEFSKEFGLDETDLEALKAIKIENTDIIFTVDSKNQPLDCKLNLNMDYSDVSSELVKAKISSETYVKYKDIGNTIVKEFNEDLTKYEDFDKILNEAEQTIFNAK